MKKLMLILISTIMLVGIYQIPTMAYTPKSPGMWVEGVLYTTSSNIGVLHEPDNINYIDAPLLNNNKNQTVTVNIPNNATYVMFRYWDYGNPNGISPPNNGFVVGGSVARKINDIYVNSSHISLGYGTEGHLTSGGRVAAYKEYITYMGNKFAKINGTDTFSINVIRTVKGVRYNYAIKYIINWQ